MRQVKCLLHQSQRCRMSLAAPTNITSLGNALPKTRLDTAFRAVLKAGSGTWLGNYQAEQGQSWVPRPKPF